MRKVTNISIPEGMDQKINKAVEEHNFASKSEFFRHLFRKWQEDQVLRGVEESRKEIKDGKGKVLEDVNELDE